MRSQIRQGDVLLVPIEQPFGELRRAMDSAGQPLAGLRVEGERTGHAHVLAGRVYDAADGGRVIMLERPGVIEHEEHAHQPVEAGWWDVRVQREHTPAAPVGRWD